MITVLLVSASPEIRPLRIYRIPSHALSRGSITDHCGCVPHEKQTARKSTETKLTVPNNQLHQRISRSAASSPVPPIKAKLPNSVK